MERKSSNFLAKCITFSFLTITGILPVKAYEQRTVGGPGNDCFTTVCATKDLGYALAGWTESYGAGGKDAWIQKYDKNGKLQWERFYGGSGDEEATRLVQDVDGSLLFFGYTTSKGSGGKDAWLVKLSKSGKIQWEKVLGGARDDEAVALNVKPEGLYSPRGYFIALNTQSKGKGGTDVQTCFFSVKGELLREVLVGTPGEDKACASQIGAYGFEVACCSLLPDSVQNWIFNMNDEFPSMDKLRRLPYQLPLQTVNFNGLCIGDNKDEGGKKFTNMTKLNRLDTLAEDVWNIKSLQQYWKVGTVFHEYSRKPYLLPCINFQNGQEKALLYALSPEEGWGIGSFTPSEGEYRAKKGFSDVIRLNNGQFLAVGYSQNETATQSDGLLCTITENDLYFSQSYGQEEEGLRLQLLPDGGFVVLGAYNGSYGVISRFDAKGRLLWVKRTGASVFSRSRFAGLLVLNNGTIVASGTDSILGYQPDGTRLFGLRRENAIACPILREGNRFLDVNYTGSILYDGLGNVQKRKTFNLPNLYSFKTNRIVQLRDGSLVFLGYSSGNAYYSSADGFSFYNNNPKAFCFGPDGKKRWEYTEPAVLGEYHFMTEMTNDTLLLCGSCLSDEKASSMFFRQIGQDGKAFFDDCSVTTNTGYPKQLRILSDTCYITLGKYRTFTRHFPHRGEFFRRDVPLGYHINDFALLPDGNYLVTGELEASGPFQRRMFVAKLNPKFHPTEF